MKPMDQNKKAGTAFVVVGLLVASGGAFIVIRKIADGPEIESEIPMVQKSISPDYISIGASGSDLEDVFTLAARCIDKGCDVLEQSLRSEREG